MDDGRICVFGGDNSAGVALRYDSSSNVWVTLPRPIPTPRYEMSSAVARRFMASSMLTLRRG